MEETGNKAMFWIGYPGMSFTRIMNFVNNNFEWAFRDFDTSTIRTGLLRESSTQLKDEIPKESEGDGCASKIDDDENSAPDVLKEITARVGNRLVLILASVAATSVFSLDGNTEHGRFFLIVPTTITTIVTLTTIVHTICTDFVRPSHGKEISIYAITVPSLTALFITLFSCTSTWRGTCGWTNFRL
jgi:hypothetical protein